VARDHTRRTDEEELMKRIKEQLRRFETDEPQENNEDLFSQLEQSIKTGGSDEPVDNIEQIEALVNQAGISENNPMLQKYSEKQKRAQELVVEGGAVDRHGKPSGFRRIG